MRILLFTILFLSACKGNNSKDGDKQVKAWIESHKEALQSQQENLEWYEELAAKHIESPSLLNYIFSITSDSQDKRQFFEQLALSGDPEAQFYLGLSYEYGVVDLKKAYIWYSLALSRGLEKARIRKNSIGRSLHKTVLYDAEKEYQLIDEYVKKLSEGQEEI